MFCPDAADLAEVSPGGPESVADWALLETAAARPMSGFGGVELFRTVFEKAAALMEAIARLHPFVDGNKRTAWIASVAFLAANGQLLQAEVGESYEFMLQVAQGQIEVDEIARWIEAHSGGR